VATAAAVVAAATAATAADRAGENQTHSW